MRIESNGNVGIRAQAQKLLLSIGDDNTGLQHPEENSLAFHTANAERVRTTPKGKVGIGTSFPSHGLHIAGSNAALRLQGTGTNGALANLNFGDVDLVYLHEIVHRRMVVLNAS